MTKKLYVGNLNHSITDNELKEIFAAYGSVLSARVIIDRESQRSKGFGFVEMSSEEEAQAAIEALNGAEVEGRPLTVNIARPRENRAGGGGDFRGGNGNRAGRFGGNAGGNDRRRY